MELSNELIGLLLIWSNWLLIYFNNMDIHLPSVDSELMYPLKNNTAQNQILQSFKDMYPIEKPLYTQFQLPSIKEDFSLFNKYTLLIQNNQLFVKCLYFNELRTTQSLVSHILDNITYPQSSDFFKYRELFQRKQFQSNIDNEYTVSIRGDKIVLKSIQYQNLNVKGTLYQFSQNVQEILEFIVVNTKPLQIYILSQKQKEQDFVYVAEIMYFDKNFDITTSLQIFELSQKFFQKEFGIPFKFKSQVEIFLKNRKALVYIYLSIDLNYLIQVEEQEVYKFQLQVLDFQNENLFSCIDSQFSSHGNFIILRIIDLNLSQHLLFFNVPKALNFMKNNKNIQKPKIDIKQIKEVQNKIDKIKYMSYLALETEDLLDIYFISSDGEISLLKVLQTEYNILGKFHALTYLDVLGIFFLAISFVIFLLHSRILSQD